MNMRHVEMPEIRLSKWHEWENRYDMSFRRFPGIYVISVSKDKKLVGNQPRWKDVGYIGMTNSKKGLLGRWAQFQRALRGEGGHSGGNRIYEEKGARDNWREYLYVAAMGIECNTNNPTYKDHLKMGWVAFLEREAMAKCIRATGSLPRYNK